MATQHNKKAQDLELVQEKAGRRGRKPESTSGSFSIDNSNRAGNSEELEMRSRDARDKRAMQADPEEHAEEEEAQQQAQDLKLVQAGAGRRGAKGSVSTSGSFSTQFGNRSGNSEVLANLE